MHSEFTWYQLIVGYIVGVVLVVNWYSFAKDCRKVLGLHHVVLAIMYVVSGFIGLEWFGTPVSDSKEAGLTVWLTIEHLLITAPWDLGVTIIVLILMYSLFAIFPLTLILLLVTLWKWMKNPDLFKER